jgi:hypothetical protein
MRENYELLGLKESATDEEITERYYQLRAKYNEERWLDGEAGNEAARMLTKIEVAYNEIKESRRQQHSSSTSKSAYEEITELLKNDRISEAQMKLDECYDRGAEWHYLQAVIFYKKNWTNDSKKQLDIAMQMDPDNAKYRSTYEKLDAKNEYQNQQAHQDPQRENPYERQGMPDDQMGGGACSNCVSCCYTYLCVDCLFSLCCGCR